MSLFEDTNPRALKDLLAEIHNRTTALPDFQRDFVWDPAATQELIVSIAYNYPAGSLLRVRDRHSYFAAREFAGAPPLDGAKHTYLVLDGQQRLTSLYQAFYGAGEHRYHLSLRKLMDGAEFEDAVFHVRAKTKWAQQHERFDVQARDLTIPLSCLRGGAGGFLNWLLAVTNPLPPDERGRMLDALTQINDKWIKTIDDYQFPVVTLSDSTEADALCTIFETLNRTGVRLSVFELLTARFWPQNVNLRELWEKVEEKHGIITEFEVDPYSVLQAVTLLSRPAASCKKGDILKLSAADIRKWWDPVVDGLVEGLHILRDDCKVALPKWLPYFPLLVPLSAVIAKSGKIKTAEAGVRREKLKRWFWCAVFGQVYENSANSQSAKDFNELAIWLAGGTEPETVARLRFDPKTLRDVTPRQRSIYRGTVCLILANGARDFYSQQVITGKLMESEGIDDHHVFPSAFLRDQKGVSGAADRDCVLNRTLIDRTTNQMIGRRAPSVYMKELRETAGFPFEEVLRSHCLPAGPTSPFWTDDYEAYLTWRESHLWEGIRRATGLTEATALEADGDAV